MFREKAFRFVNLALELGISDGPGLIGQVLDKLNRRQLAKLRALLKDFHQHETINRWANRRNSFVHGLAKEELPELSSMQMVLSDVLRKDGDVDDEWTVLQESEKLDAYADRQGQEMEAALEYLKRFRQDIANELESKIT